jgi:hypothetical protein
MDYPNHFDENKQEISVTNEDPKGIYAKSFVFYSHPTRLIQPIQEDDSVVDGSNTNSSAGDLSK